MPEALVLQREARASNSGGASAQLVETTTPRVIAVPAGATELIVGRAPGCAALSTTRSLSIDATALSRTRSSRAMVKARW